MDDKRLKRVTIEKAVESADSSYYTENFIIANNEAKKFKVFFHHPYAFDGICFLLCLKGTAKISLNLQEYLIKQNTIVIVSPNLIWEILEKSEDFIVDLLLISYDFIPNLPITNRNYDLREMVHKQPVIHIPEKDSTNILRYLTFIKDTFCNNRHQYIQDVIKGLVYSLIQEIAVLYQNSTEAHPQKTNLRGVDIVNDFLKLLRENVKEHREADFYSDKLFISTKYLSITLRKLTGRSVNIWIQEAILQQAKLLLKQDMEKSVAQISDELNFSCATTFGRFFNEHTGLTPFEYRNA